MITKLQREFLFDNIIVSYVKAPDGHNIIVYGGITSDTTIAPMFLILDTNSFVWRTPNFANNDLTSQTRLYGQAAVIYKNCMIVAFGKYIYITFSLFYGC